MRVLFIAHRIPFPPNKGDKIRSYNILRYLAARHEVHLACVVDDEADLRFVPELEKWASRVAYVHVASKLGRLRAAAGVLQLRPLSVAFFHHKGLQRQIDEILANQDIDAIFCSSSPTAEYVFRSTQKRARTARRLMDFIDVDSAKWRQYAARSPFWSAWIYRYEAWSLATYEARIAAAFDRLFVVSEEERSYFPATAAHGKLTAISNGVDLQFFSPRATALESSEPPALVFTGMMDYWPNIEGIEWFVERIFPRIRSAVGDVRLFIVGNRPSAQVVRLGTRPGVTVTGFVADVRDYIASAAVCVVPLRIARGIQNKLLEAMAMGKAVVSTREAFEGLKAEKGRDLLVAADEESFAAETVSLLRDRERARRLGTCARQCVERHYSWDSNLRPLDEALRADDLLRLQPTRVA